MELHSWFVDLHNWLSEPHLQFCTSINREHWRSTIIRNYVSPSTELRSSINWIKELHKSIWVLHEYIREIHQSIIMGLHMWFKELHNPTSFMELNNWYLQPHSWFTEIHNWFCCQYNIIDLWSPMIKSPRSGVTLCFQFVSAPSIAAATTTFTSHVKTV